MVRESRSLTTQPVFLPFNHPAVVMQDPELIPQFLRKVFPYPSPPGWGDCSHTCTRSMPTNHRKFR